MKKSYKHMSLIKDLKNVKDEEITLQDVVRAQALIDRANKLLNLKAPEAHYPITIVRPLTYPSQINPNVWFWTTENGSTSSTNLNQAVNKIINS